jgi:hypothetical protein
VPYHNLLVHGLFDLKFKGLFYGVFFLFACMHELLSVWNCLIINIKQIRMNGGWRGGTQETTNNFVRIWMRDGDGKNYIKT